MGGLSEVELGLACTLEAPPVLTSTEPSIRGKGPNILTNDDLSMLQGGAVDGSNADAKTVDGDGKEVVRGMKDEEGRGGRNEEEAYCDEVEAILGTGTWYPACAVTSLDGGLKAHPLPGAGTAIIG